eukprot:4415247-Amphidinium_carterae.1
MLKYQVLQVGGLWTTFDAVPCSAFQGDVTQAPSDDTTSLASDDEWEKVEVYVCQENGKQTCWHQQKEAAISDLELDIDIAGLQHSAPTKSHRVTSREAHIPMHLIPGLGMSSSMGLHWGTTNEL